MLLNVLNENFEKIAIIDKFSSLIWCKRYNEVGALDLQIEATKENINLLKKNYYLTRDDDNTIYKINAIKLNTQANKDNSLLIGGIDCKNILFQRIIWNKIIFNGTVENFIRKIIYDNIINPTDEKRKINNFELSEIKNYTDLIAQQTTYKNVGEKIQELCKIYNYGYEVNYINNKFIFNLYKGSNKENIIFSPIYDNLASSNFEYDNSKYKNISLVGGVEVDGKRTLVEVGNAEGLNRFELFSNAGSISNKNKDGSDIPEEEYKEQLKSFGKENLSKNKIKENFSGDIIIDYYKYKKDYNLGDIVTIENEFGISIKAMISEIIEVWDNEGYSLQPNFEYIQM